MQNRMGRPKTGDPRLKQIGVRFGRDELKKLDALTEHYGETRVAVLRRGMEKLFSEIKK